MALLQYFSSLVEELNRKSDLARCLFSTHKPTAGDHRESKVSELLSQHLPKRYAVSSGLIISTDGQFSNQSDIIIADNLNNAPLFDEEHNKIWLVESVYAAIEVKTQLTPSTLQDSIAKCQRFKRMKRMFFKDHVNQRIDDSLFIIWGFYSPSSETLYKNYRELIEDVPVEEQPDFVICPSKLLIKGGQYRKLADYGQPGSEYYEKNQKIVDPLKSLILSHSTECLELKENSLITFIAWVGAWLQAAGDRTAMLGNYVINEKNIGRRIL
ncbi:hypothetical protein ABVD54_005017 [Vibrio parahaemolyticus]|uniref:DUF6602 domain-containing protein n=1 Tax=Vibrio parahaemolyticus TaxID=670 RepID=UPI0006A5B948|nr:DUF6602 domain-containing protein [Vibrio parahaemolyticus]EGQ7815815.1 hypothetical protein [Vibrio parahaemolyticus]EGQ8735145.1 hypothetical protein [Vibrio parahaemolyticus]EGQ8886965.1 hypothetical protein [Vibrio parahaemolyticus]EGQ8917796.1 hypothetical protein [Vibrio parahaemolyticus]EGQ8936214.1 hypothetical protein [Vibrio parahaemolyticus]